MDQNILSLIKSIGFKDKESKVYLALLELGLATVSEVSRRSQIKRPTTYLVLEELTRSGCVTQLQKKTKKQYQAVDPAVILVKKRSDLKYFSEMVPYLQTLHNAGGEKPKIHYVETKEGIWNIYESLNFAKQAFYISSYQKINDLFPGKVEQWISGYKRNHYKVRAKHLVSDDEIVFGKKYQQAGQMVRRLPKKFDTDLVLTEDKLAISCLDNAPFLVLIESKKLATSLRPLFEILWEASREL